ncbi:MAG TPA: AAA family ATPase [Gaiellaceae bacterium]|nr:AAA family ATPase [Gaiellaceae bacterium]
MHLARVGLRGFKSFPDPVELRFEPGVAILVGPNGSGKSNVADAIVWASGSLSPTELRAEKPDDVLFAGAGDRLPAAFCEVELVFEDAEGAGGLDFSTLAIARRLHRGGEGQYLLGRASVRRTDVVEVLAELGLGRSIVGQGRVEEILSSRPEELRAMVEDAAGLGVFKRRRHRAELKLARVATQVERARDVEAEVRARIRPLALQATAAERAERLAAELAALEARLAALDAALVEEQVAELEERRTAVGLARRRSDERLEALLAERRGAEDELEDAAGRRESATAALYRMRSGAERLTVRSEAIGRLVEPLRRDAEESERAAAHRPTGPTRAQLEAAAAAARAERDAAKAAERVARERLATLERILEEREGLPPAARALAERGERLVLSELEVAPGEERAITAGLGARASALVASDPQAALALLERARAEGLGSLSVVVDGALDEVRVVEPEELLAAESGIAATREGFAYDATRGELRYAGEPAEALVLELEARRKELAEEVEDAARRADDAAATAEGAERLAREAAARPSPRRLGDPVILRRLAEIAERADADLAAAALAAARLETPLRARVDAGAARAGEMGAELRRLGAAEAELRREAAEAGERAAALEVEAARLSDELQALRERAGDSTVEEGEERDELAARVERTRRRLEGVGPVNPLAKEEVERERERLAELVAQREDLERSLDELEGLRAELTDTVERRFEETFAAVRDGFADVAATLFPGGEGRLRLTEPDEEEDDAPGVGIELRPAGKKVTRLSLLSGGERSLGAIAFLFALFLARPCPFYLLDEVDAALDDTNIGRFVELLRRYAARAQFVVVTHQKRTMEAADVLYGVTMGPDGVSQVVSRRQPRQEVALAS